MTPLIAVTTPLGGLREMLSHPFIRHALISGTAIAVPSGLASYVIVLRRQVFTSDALGHVAFTGALAALAFGVDLRLGLFAATATGALMLGALGTRARADDVVIGGFFAWTLGLGVLFLSIFTTSHSGGNGVAGGRVLFGSIFGLDREHTRDAIAIGAGITVALLAIARPLLFATVDEAVAEARRVPVRALGYAFLVLVAITVGEATQAIGALLVLGLLATPGGIAQRLTVRPYRGLALSCAAAVGAVWIGVTLSYVIPRWPPSFSIIAVLATAYFAVILGTSAATRLRARHPTATPSRDAYAGVVSP